MKPLGIKDSTSGRLGEANGAAQLFACLKCHAHPPPFTYDAGRHHAAGGRRNAAADG